MGTADRREERPLRDLAAAPGAARARSERRRREGVRRAVDVETGEVVVERIYAVHDIGRVINPLGAESQIEGGIIQAIGHTLSEQRLLDPQTGKVLTRTLDAYKLPTIADVPPLRIVHLSDGHGVGPYGARSAGELVNPGVPAAIANAVHDASGARVHTLPVTAERVWTALKGR